jgi:hypothetical protein
VKRKLRTFICGQGCSLDIWITRCRRERKCNFCPEKIELAQPMVEGKLWMRHGDAKRWPIRFAWHIECWVKQGLIVLEDKPYVAAGNRGRKKLDMPEDRHTIRVKLLRRRAAAFFRLRAAAEEGNVNLVIKTMTLMEKIAEEIEPYGGVPESWVM